MHSQVFPFLVLAPLMGVLVVLPSPSTATACQSNSDCPFVSEQQCYSGMYQFPSSANTGCFTCQNKCNVTLGTCQNQLSVLYSQFFLEITNFNTNPPAATCQTCGSGTCPPGQTMCPIQCEMSRNSLDAGCRPSSTLSQQNQFCFQSSGCQSCPQYCEPCNCFYNGTCQGCMNGYFSVSSTQCAPCTTSCLPNQFISQACQTTSNAVCTNCNNVYPNCQTCTSSTCLSCEGGYYMSPSSPETCVPCSNISPQCTECTTSTSSGEAVCTSCRDGYFPAGGVCESCGQPCTQCSSAGNCSVCDQPFFADLETGNCTACPSPQCPPTALTLTTCGGSNGAGTCKPCSEAHYACVECGDLVAEISPPLPFKIDQYQNGTVSSVYFRGCFICEPGFYPRPRNGADSFEHSVYLNYECARCDSCGPGTFVEDPCKQTINLSVQNFTGNAATTTVAEAYFASRLPFSQTVCKTCSVANCYSCPTNGQQCTECAPGYWPSQQVNGSILQCSQCTANCAACVSNTNCTTCMGGYYPAANGTCVACSSTFGNNCYACTNFGCTNCLSGFFAQTGVCVPCSSCNESGQYTSASCGVSSDTSCTNCSVPMPGCTRCLGPTNCLECSSPVFVLDAGSCITCNSPAANLGSCAICAFTQQGYLSCSQCQSSSSYLQNSQDLNGNPIVVCTACSASVMNCNTCSAQACLSCQSGYFLTTWGTCAPCQTTCGFQQYDLCTATADMGCQSCSSSCSMGNYITAPCTATSDITCSPCPACPLGTHVTPLCNLTTPCVYCNQTFGTNCSTCNSATCTQCLHGLVPQSSGICGLPTKDSAGSASSSSSSAGAKVGYAFLAIGIVAVVCATVYYVVRRQKLKASGGRGSSSHVPSSASSSAQLQKKLLNEEDVDL